MMVTVQQTYIVGLGRLGAEAVEHFKRRTQATWGELPAIKLLVIDAPDVEPPDPPTDEPPLSVLGPTEGINLPLELPAKPALKVDPTELQRLLPWLPQEVVARGEAWRHTRAAARAAWHLNLPALYPFLAAHLNEMGSAAARDAMAAKGFDVPTDRSEAALILIGDIGDRVAGGLLLDVAYVFHHLFQTAGLHTAGTALLFLPSLTRSDPLAEARAYATLKEINAHIGAPLGKRRLYRCVYGAPDNPFLVIESDAPVFNYGCYLIDTRNEKTLTLKDEREAARLAGEWLVRTVLTPLKGRVDEFVSAQSTLPWAQGQPAAYNSLGLASYVAPIDNLLSWSACRLGEAMLSEQLLKPESFAVTADKLSGLMSAVRLRPEDLLNTVLRRDRDGKPIRLHSDLIERLKTLPRGQIAAAAQATLNTLNKDTVPTLRRHIEGNVRRVVQDVEEALDQEVATLLRSRPIGGLSVATQLVARIRDDAGRFLQSLDRREAALLARNQHQVNFLARQGPLLKQAVAGVPRAPIIALAALGGFLAPLVLATAWLSQVLEFAPLPLRLGVIGSTWLTAVAGALYAVWQGVFGVERIRDQYLAYLQNRFETELSLITAQAARTVYSDVMTTAERRLNRLEQFGETLRDLARTYHRRVEETHLVGAIDFSLQRSALTEMMVDALYRRYAGATDDEAHTYALMERVGPLDRWLDWSREQIELSILDYTESLFAPMREVRVESLARELDDLDRLARELNDRSAPLCGFNVYHAGQSPISTVQTFIGLESPDQSELRAIFERVNPLAVFETTGDPHAVVVTSVRRGMPLFSLLRLGDLRRNYFDVLRQRSEPLHLEDELALTADLAALSSGLPDQMQSDPGSAFALGLAFGLIGRDGPPDGLYVAHDATGAVIARLASQRLESAVLLGADDKLLARINQLIQERLASQSSVELARQLTSYRQRSDLSDWERRRLDECIALLRR
ncbi:MAG: tubulin-like doman-containing protein [Anaerolineae bacterium]|nr:tubulin-like doman-containing protein [Thermoflexales bacterium]MDW8406614.1 tubulin-like doman-containing protein [Anaerolineae bacterium]